ncbi:hypothetical protein Hdeb2414_s0007g00251961 [Helianthus debilis subsp. tardiflorus]
MGLWRLEGRPGYNGQSGHVGAALGSLLDYWILLGLREHGLEVLDLVGVALEVMRYIFRSSRDIISLESSSSHLGFSLI